MSSSSSLTSLSTEESRSPLSESDMKGVILSSSTPDGPNDCEYPLIDSQESELWEQEGKPLAPWKDEGPGRMVHHNIIFPGWVRLGRTAPVALPW